MYDVKTRILCALKRVFLYVLVPQIPTILAEFELFFPEFKAYFAVFGLIAITNTERATHGNRINF